MDSLGPNALGEVLEPGRVGDCYLGLLLPPGPAGGFVSLATGGSSSSPCSACGTCWSAPGRRRWR
jgi:hypothetical protein